MTMNYMSQPPRTNINAMSMRYMKDRIGDEDELKLKMQQQTLEDTAGTKKTDDDITQPKEDTPSADVGMSIDDPAGANDQDDNESITPQEQETLTKAEAESASPYKILHALPGYELGDTLRQEDMMIVHSKEASAFAMNRVQIGDCAFILRSEGSFTYSIYEGSAENNPDLLSFQVDKRGHFKVLPAKQFLTRVKVPVLPVALIGTPMDKYSEYNAKTRKEDEETKKKRAQQQQEEQGRSSSSANMGEMTRATSVGQKMNRRASLGSVANQQPALAGVQMSRRPSSGSLATQQQQTVGGPSLSRRPSSGSLATAASGMRRVPSSGTIATQKASPGIKRVPSSGASIATASLSSAAHQSTSKSLPRATSMGQLGLRRPVMPNRTTHQQQQLGGSNDAKANNALENFMAMSCKQSLPSIPQSRPAATNQQQLDSNNILSQMVTASTQKGLGTGMRVASMQDFRQKMSNSSLGSVPESSNLKLKAPTNQSPFTLTRNSASVSSFGSGGSAGLMSRRSSGSLSNRSGMMPRNVTLRRINEASEDGVGDSGNGSNASWEVASSMACNNALSDNPLLNRVASIGTNNPMLKAVEARDVLSSVKSASLHTMEMAPSMQPQQLEGTPNNREPNNSNGDTPQPKTYSIGDRIPANSMPETSTSEMKQALIVSKLKVNDMAFVRRSDKSWAYARVSKKDLDNITFEVNAKGDTKTIDLLNAGRYVRILEEESIMNVMKIGRVMVSSGDEEKREEVNDESVRSGSHKSTETDPAEPAQRRRVSDPRLNGGGPVLCRRSSAGSSNMPRTMSEHSMSRMPRRQSSVSTVLGGNPSNSSLSRTASHSSVRTGTGTRRRSSRLSVEGDGGNGTANASWDAMTPPSSAIPPNSIETSTHPSSIVPDNNQVAVLQVQCKTEDGGNKMVPMYKVGMDVYYKRSDNVESATILEVHLDDLLEPYYTIELEDGREKQTDNAHITLER